MTLQNTGTHGPDMDSNQATPLREITLLPDLHDQDDHWLYKSEEGYTKLENWYANALKRIQIPVESVWADSRYGKTHMLAAGPADGEPLFLIPGVAGAAPLFRRQLEGLADQFRVYAVDVVGQPGKSAPNPPSVLDNSFVDWFCDVLDSMGLEQAHVAGQSVGGGMAMRIGIEAPERVKSVIMFGPTGLARSRLPVKIWLTKVASNRSADALEEDLTAKSIRPEHTGESFGTYDRELARLMALATRNFRVDKAIGVYNEENGRVAIIKGLKVLHKFFFAEKKAWQSRLKVPSLLIFGEHELFFDPHKIAARTEEIIPGIRTEVVPHAGHGAVYDQPEKVNELVREFINELNSD